MAHVINHEMVLCKDNGNYGMAVPGTSQQHGCPTTPVPCPKSSYFVPQQFDSSPLLTFRPFIHATSATYFKNVLRSRSKPRVSTAGRRNLGLATSFAIEEDDPATVACRTIYDL